MWRRLFQRKSLEVLLKEMAGEHRLHRVLGPVLAHLARGGSDHRRRHLCHYGPRGGGGCRPGILLSFVVAGTACAFAALCYAEFAALAPVAGSAYTYTYATLG